MSLDAPADLSNRDEALAYLLSRIDYERMTSIPYSEQDFKLDRMRGLLAQLGDPHLRLPVVHIAGTKGKGSTSAMTAAILSAAGLRTGLYTSPHLTRIEERLMIDGTPCPSDVFVDLVREVAGPVRKMDEDAAVDGGPTYFEILTAMAFVYFCQRKLDAAVLEVGLGGRLDSTNVCQPVITAITSISFDHVKQLGNTLAEIAGEKAGIIKSGVPVVSGVLQPEPKQVIQQIAAKNAARVVQLGADFDFNYRPGRVARDEQQTQPLMDYWRRKDGQGRGEIYSSELNLSNVSLNLVGRHQAANAAVAVTICGELAELGWKITEQHLRNGLQNVVWPGRLEVLQYNPTVVLDAAHNVASIAALVQTLNESFGRTPRRLIFATTRDKDIRGMLEVILPEFDEVIFTRYLSNPRSVPPDELAAIASQAAPIRVRMAETPREAWDLAMESARSDELLVITGSFFIAGEVRDIAIAR